MIIDRKYIALILRYRFMLLIGLPEYRHSWYLKAARQRKYDILKRNIVSQYAELFGLFHNLNWEDYLHFRAMEKMETDHLYSQIFKK